MATAITQKQQDLAVKFQSQLEALGIPLAEVTKDAWRFQAIGRVLEPKAEVLGAIKALKGRPVYARSSREAQMQYTALLALQALMQGNADEAKEILKKEFMQRETA